MRLESIVLSTTKGLNYMELLMMLFLRILKAYRRKGGFGYVLKQIQRPGVGFGRREKTRMGMGSLILKIGIIGHIGLLIGSILDQSQEECWFFTNVIIHRV